MYCEMSVTSEAGIGAQPRMERHFKSMVSSGESLHCFTSRMSATQESKADVE